MKKHYAILFLLLASFGFSQTKEIDSLTIQLAFQNQDSSKVNTSLYLVKALYNNNNYDKALKFINETEKLSTDLNYNYGLAEGMYYKALIYTHKKDYINAINTYKTSKQLFELLRDTLGIAKINSKLGIIEIERGNYKEGLKYAHSAIKELEERNLQNELRVTYQNLANAYYNIGAFQKAIEYYSKNLTLEEELNSNVGKFTAYNKLAESYSMQKENRKAIDYYEKALSLPFSHTDSIRSEILPKLGSEYLQFKDYNKATSLLIEGLQLNRAQNNSHGLLLTLNSLGTLNFQLRNFKTAEAQLLEANAIAEKLQDNEALLANYKSLKTLDSTLNRFNSAYVWQRKYYDLKTKLIPVKTSVDEALLETEIGTEQLVETIPQETKPAKAETSQKSNFLNSENLKILFYVLISILVIIMFIIVFGFSKKNATLKQLQDLEDENKKLELQNEAIIEQTKHLEDVNKVKDKLFSIVSHDLKDSLTSINGFIDLLKDGSLSQQEFEKLIPELSENASNASLLLFNLLNWSKSQMQSLEPNPSLFDVQEVFEEKLKLLDQRFTAKNINIVDHTLRDFVYADRSMLEIIVQNLLTNALKFTRPGGTITVSNHISNGNSILGVSDTGVGIPKENLDKLFKANSLTTIGTKNEKGTGLGLSICKELTELNKGKIWVESTLNVGTT